MRHKNIARHIYSWRVTRWHLYCKTRFKNITGVLRQIKEGTTNLSSSLPRHSRGILNSRLNRPPTALITIGQLITTKNCFVLLCRCRGRRWSLRIGRKWRRIKRKRRRYIRVGRRKFRVRRGRRGRYRIRIGRTWKRARRVKRTRRKGRHEYIVH